MKSAYLLNTSTSKTSLQHQCSDDPLPIRNLSRPNALVNPTWKSAKPGRRLKLFAISYTYLIIIAVNNVMEGQCVCRAFFVDIFIKFL